MDSLKVVTYCLGSSDTEPRVSQPAPMLLQSYFCNSQNTVCFISERITIFVSSFCSLVIPIARLGHRCIVFIYEFPFWITSIFYSDVYR